MIDAIVESFTGLDTMHWISQISGLIGLVVIGIAYLFKKKKFLLIATISFIFFIMENIFAGLYSNLIVCSVCFVRNLLMFIYVCKDDRSLPKVIVYSLIGVMWAGVLIYMGVSHTFNVWDNYLPPLIVTMSTMTQNSKNEYVVKVGATLHETGYLVYFLIYRLPFSILRQVILVTAAVVGIVLLLIKRKKDSNEEVAIQE